jgi:hypothetical protein
VFRVPFVQRCAVSVDDGASLSAFVVNINVLGAYLAHDELPAVGRGVVCRFDVPGSQTALEVRGTVVWANARRPRLAHGLPPGFAVKFDGLSSRGYRQIERLVREYVTRNPATR